jgi:hypothetical protein
MNFRRVLLLILLQCALLGSLAAKYFYDRHRYPRVWTTATLYDPDLAFRGRYLALNLNADGCSLPVTHSNYNLALGPAATTAKPAPEYFYWSVRLHAADGKLIATNAENMVPSSLNLRATRTSDIPCEKTSVGQVNYFVPDSFQLGKVMQTGDALWVEVTVPPVGTPRPIQLAVVHNGAFTPLKLH